MRIIEETQLKNISDLINPKYLPTMIVDKLQAKCIVLSIDEYDDLLTQTQSGFYDTYNEKIIPKKIDSIHFLTDEGLTLNDEEIKELKRLLFETLSREFNK